MIDNGNGMMLESFQRYGERLAESWSRQDGKRIRGWEDRGMVDFLEGVDDPYKRAFLAMMMENTHKYINNLDEATRSVHVGPYEKFLFPLIRAVFANLVSGELVSLQSLPTKTGQIFYMDIVAGQAKGDIAQGAKLFDARYGPHAGSHFSDETIDNEYVGASGSTNYTGTLSYLPLRPGTVVITDGTQTITDDGHGRLVGDIQAATNTINYGTGVFDTTFAVNAYADVYVDYQYNMEAPSSADYIPSVDMILTSTPVVARPNKLRARWSIEAEQDLMAYHGVSAEVELVSAMANLIQKEINYKVVNTLLNAAAAGSVTWDKTAPSGVAWVDHRLGVIDAIVEAGNLIFSAVQQGGASWLVADVKACNILEALPTPIFQRDPTGLPAGSRGIYKTGTVEGIPLYKDPNLDDGAYDKGQILVGYKGTSFLEAGFVLAMYLGLYTTPTLTFDDFISRKGIAQQSAQKLVNSKMYAKVVINET